MMFQRERPGELQNFSITTATLKESPRSSPRSPPLYHTQMIAPQNNHFKQRKQKVTAAVPAGGYGKAAHSPRTKKNDDFFGQIFRLRFFYTEPREAWVRSHTSCVNFFLLQMLATFGIFTQVSHIYTSVTIFTQECHIFRHLWGLDKP